jgi:hypothetical protein
LEEPPAIPIASGDEHVEQDEVGEGTTGQTVQCIVAVHSHENREPLLSQNSGQSLSLSGIVFDYQDCAASHLLSPRSEAACADSTGA